MSSRRPSRSIRGFARRVQMGYSESIFVVTEGENTDRWYYDRLLRSDMEIAARGILTYTVASLSRGLKGHEGREGKAAVLALFNTLRATRQLKQTNSSGTKTMIFCVDADHDRFTGRMQRSDHLIYTRLPDVEAHVIDDADLQEVISLVASIVPQEAAIVVDALGDWQTAFASARLEWMILCCTAETMAAPNCPSAGTPPPRSKTDPLSPAPQADVEMLRQRLKDAFPTRNHELKKHEDRARARFTKAVNSGNAANAIKGKWSIKFLKRRLEDEVEKVVGHTTTIPEDSILSVAKAQAVFTGEWHILVQNQVRRTLDPSNASSQPLPAAAS